MDEHKFHDWIESAGEEGIEGIGRLLSPNNWILNKMG